MDWAFTFQRAMRDVFWGLVRTPAEKRDMKAIEAGCEQTAKLLPVLEHNLAGLAYARRRYEQGERHARRAVSLRRAAGANACVLAADQAVLAAVLTARGHYDEARRQLHRALVREHVLA